MIGDGLVTMRGTGRERRAVTLVRDERATGFRGTWAGSMIGRMFVYDGALAQGRPVLTLKDQGPSFSGDGEPRYRRVITIESDDVRLLESEVQGGDGS